MNNKDALAKCKDGDFVEQATVQGFTDEELVLLMGVLCIAMVYYAEKNYNSYCKETETRYDNLYKQCKDLKDKVATMYEQQRRPTWD